MVARLTVASDKWSDGHAIASMVIEQSDEAIRNSLALADRDADAFESVMAAYRMPKDEASDQLRTQAIREATIGAARPPLEILFSASELIHQLLELSWACNKNALTDLASSAELAHTAARMAEMNVRVNTDYLEGEDVNEIDHSANDAMGRCNVALDDVRASFRSRLGW
jgi:formiminotetrahydrofolate cyclodeaminase